MVRSALHYGSHLHHRSGFCTTGLCNAFASRNAIERGATHSLSRRVLLRKPRLIRKEPTDVRRFLLFWLTCFLFLEEARRLAAPFALHPPASIPVLRHFPR